MRIYKFCLMLTILTQPLCAQEDVFGIEETVQPTATLTTDEIMQLNPAGHQLLNDYIYEDTNSLNLSRNLQLPLQNSSKQSHSSDVDFLNDIKYNLKASVKVKPNFTGIVYPAGFSSLDPFGLNPLRPDPSGSVGPQQYIAFCLGKIRSFNKIGRADGVLDISPEVFFSSVLPKDVPGWHVNFPQIQYDHFANRWYLVAINELDATTPNQIILAVSNGPVITKHTQWKFYAFPQISTLYRQLPTLGVGPNALFIGSTPFVTGTEGFVINKKKLLKGKLRVSQFDFSQNDMGGFFYSVGVTIFDKTCDVGYFIGVDETNPLKRLAIRIIKDPGSRPYLLPDPVFIDISPIARAIDVPQMGSAINLTSRQFLPTSSHRRNGFIYYTLGC